MKTMQSLLILILLSVNILAQIDSNNVYKFFIDGKEYQIVKMNMNWADASEYAFNQGGILAEINSQEEQDSIFVHTSKAGIIASNTVSPDGGNASYLWIGGNDMAEEGKWVWDGANDGLGIQFWEGLSDGNPVDSLYNNWGREPDNFGNQDALGLAITNWPRGLKGEWNDVSINNKLYFVIEFDNSIIKTSKVNYDYNSGQLYINGFVDENLDSLQIDINDKIHKTYYDVQTTDSAFVITFHPDSTSEIRVRLVGYSGDKLKVSKIHKLLVYSFKNPVNSFTTDFENLSGSEFIGNGFEIIKPGGFRNLAIHSLHHYEPNSEYIFTLTKPIIISNSNPIMTYSDVAIIEPGDSGSVFGNENFKDYVIIEGSNEVNKWKALSPGYDASLHPEWQSALGNTTLYRNLYKQQSIDLSNTFEVGDTILIRFRLYSDSEIEDWGWTIDSLNIQGIPLSAKSENITPGLIYLAQNFPNPFNPTTKIRFNLSNSSLVRLEVFNILGEKITTLVNGIKAKGMHEIEFTGKDLPAGVYFYRISLPEYSETRKMLLLK